MTSSEFVRLLVADNGTGIPETDKERIFQPFESSKGSGGTGLGLPVTRKILREHGGDATFQSGSSGGTTFELRWPLRKQGPPPTLPG